MYTFDDGKWLYEQLMKERKMKRFYNTMSPDERNARFLFETEKEAIDDARRKTEEDGRTRYVVIVLNKIESVPQPSTKVTKLY